MDYKDRGTRGSKSEVVDQKRINKVHDNRVSHLLSHTVNGKGKVASNSVTIGKQLHDHNSRDSRSASLSKATISDGKIIIIPSLIADCSIQFNSILEISLDWHAL